MMRRSFLRLLICVVLLGLYVNPVYAAPVDESQWEVPFLGVMKGPAGFTVVDLEQWMKQLEPALNPVNVQKEGITAVPMSKFDKMQLPPEVKIYQLQVDSGNAYHIAWALVFKDNKPAAVNVAGYFAPAQQEFIDKINGMLQVGMKEIENQSEKTGIVKVKVLNLAPVARLDGSSEVVYSVGGRLIIDSKGMIIPLYMKNYFFNREGKLVSATIVTSDSDGEFWRDMSDQLFVTVAH